jgi:hypothetical protein
VKRLVHSDAGKTLLDAAGRQELEELCAYWEGKSMSDRHQAVFTRGLGRYWKYEGTFLWSQWSELGIPDYEELFRVGLDGRIALARERLQEIDRTVRCDYVDQKEFLQSVVIALEAVVRFAGRYAPLAAEMAAAAPQPERRRQLEEVARRDTSSTPRWRSASGSTTSWAPTTRRISGKAGSRGRRLWSFSSSSGRSSSSSASRSSPRSTAASRRSRP